MTLTLYGYRYSVYTRIARMTLAALNVDYISVEVDPFADPPDPELAKVTRFHRVPVLDHDGFTLCETSVITRYLATTLPGTNLIPDGPKAQARMAQTIAIIDAYGYWPMVRQVFSHGVFRPLIGADADPQIVQQGLAAATPILAQLNDIAAEGLVLNGPLTLADLHLAPMLGYFAMAPQGAQALQTHPALTKWWDKMQQHPTYIATDPSLATLSPQA
ncbi:glutathione S-transferase family protein [Tateyamaria sp.]|uniref:glutathione S-transferase family protein n=1 Tax=Tateyamaria sp. TaxID=1929288 RepID=UPI003B219961